MTILESKKKELVVPCLVYREGKTSLLEDVRIWFTCQVKFSIWSGMDDFKDDFLTLSLGHMGSNITKERVLRVFLTHEGGSCEEIDWHSKRNGLSITKTKLKPVAEDEVFTLYKSGKYRILREESPSGELVNAQINM